MMKIDKRKSAMKNYRILAVLLSLTMGVTTIVSNPVIAYAEEKETTSETTAQEVVKIETVQDLKSIATNSVNDSYTLHKKFVLQNDIDLSGSDYKPIAIFAGEFDGNGHTIKGVKLLELGDNTGFFQYVEATGKVSNLTIEGKIQQVEKKENVGGIVGTNKGTIQNCTFRGEIMAQQCVGGIAGYNRESGMIVNCNNEGTLIGTKRIGGIVGWNEGNVQNCTNQGDVNATDQTVYDFGEETTLEFSVPNMSMDKEEIKKNLQDEKKINYIGGIAGVSSGTVDSCENFGTIGYSHMGYTIGGVVGYQRGILINANNYGSVNGRKDIGGIVGILEPLVEADYSEDTTDKLQSEMDTMLTLMDDLSDKTRAGGDTATNDVDQIRDRLKDLRQTIRNHRDYYDKRLDVFDDGLDSRVNSIDQLLDDLDFNIDDDGAKQAFNKIKSDAEQLSKILMQIKEIEATLTAYHLGFLPGQAGIAVASFEPAAPMALIPNDVLTPVVPDTDIDNADAVTGVTPGGDEGAGSGSRDSGSGESGSGSCDSGSGESGSGSNGSESGEGGDSDQARAIMTSESMIPVEENVSRTFTMCEAAPALTLQQQMQLKMQKMTELSAEAEKLMDDMSAQGNKISKILDQATEEKTEFKDDLKDLDDHVDELRYFLRSQRDSLKKDFDKTDAEIKEQTDKVVALMDQLSIDFKDSRADVRAQMDLIQNQMHAINDTVGDGLDELRKKLDKDIDEEDPIEDVSDTDDTTPTAGKVMGCRNEGEVAADIDGGGIAGSMMIVKDAESDFEIVKKGQRSLEVDKRESAVIRNCINLSDITVRNDYAGGIVGRSDVGAIIASENYGNIEATDGDYAGGIAGKSDFLIRNSYSLCDIKGNDYCGGVVGLGKNIKNNTAMAGIQNTDGGSKGTIAGKADEEGEISGNRFVEEGIGAVEGLSYEQQAIPMKYEELIAMEGIPAEFYTFYVKFVVDNKVIKKITCKYGDKISLEDYPEVPEKDGKVGFWENVDLTNINRNKTIHGIYDTWTTTISSDEKIPVLLISGDFYNDTVLQYNKEKNQDLSLAGYKVVDVYTFSMASQNALPTGAMKVRVLADDYRKDAAIAVYDKDRLVPVAVQRDGRYLVFITNGTGKFAVIYKNNIVRNVLLVLLLLIVVFGILCYRKKKGKNVIPKVNRKRKERRKNK